MSQEILARQVLLTKLTGKAAQGRSKTRWGDYISHLAWSRLDVGLAELSKIAENPEVFRAHRGLLPPRPSPEENGCENK